MRYLVLAATLLVTTAPAVAQDDDHELAKKLANPGAALVTVPLQFNYDCCYTPAGSDRVLLNIQPVIPFELSPNWNLIMRTILPVIDQQSAVPGGGTHFGFGDTTQSFFFSSVRTDGLTLAAGPALLYPTATDAVLGSHKWGAGPTGLLVLQQGGWTYGILANHIWSYGGESEYRNLSNTQLQPFLSHTWPDTTSLSLNMEGAYDWTAKQWTTPINLMAGHMFRFGDQRVNFQLGGRYYADRPHGSASWGLRFGMTFLFPR